MKRWDHAGCATLLVLCLVLSRQVSFAQSVPLEKFQGEYSLGGDYIRQNAGDDLTHDLLLQQRLRIRTLDAALWDPRLARFSLGANFGFSQSFRNFLDQMSFATLWGYDAVADILPLSPLAFGLFARRNQYYLSRELTSRTEVVATSHGFRMSFRRFYIPSWIVYREEFYQMGHLAETEGEDGAFMRENRRNLLYHGRRGWIDSEAVFRYEYIDLADEITPDMSYRSHEGNAYYSIDLGPELNWRWDSRLRAYTRKGPTSAYSIAEIDELVSAKHSSRLRSEYRVNGTYTRSDDVINMSQSAFAGVQHRLYRSLTTRVRGDVLLQEAAEGSKRVGRNRLDFVYNKKLRGRGRVTAGLGGGLQYENDEFSSGESYTAREEHEAETPVAYPLALDNLQVTENTIVVTKIAVPEGDLPLGCEPVPVPVILEPGRDYLVRTVGYTTEIVPLPCNGTSPGINPGDTVSVDYAYAAPNMTFYTTSIYADVGLHYPWFSVRAGHEQLDQNLISGGGENLLENLRTDSAGAELRWTGEVLRLALTGEVSRSQSRYQSYRGVRSGGSVSLRFRPSFSMSLNGDQSLMRYYDTQDCQDRADTDCVDWSAPDRVSNALGGRLSITYNLGYRFLLEAYVRNWWLDAMFEDSEQYFEQVTEANLRWRWLFRRLEVNSSVTYSSRRRDGVGPGEFRAMLQVRRKLF